MPNIPELLRLLPGVDQVLQTEAFRQTRLPRRFVTWLVRNELQALRQEIRCGKVEEDFNLQTGSLKIRGRLETALKNLEFSGLSPVINATGVILNTNLGRAPLSAVAASHVETIARQYSNLEFDLSSGKRGDRLSYINQLAQCLFECRGALVVNNNAAALFLALRALAAGKEVLISRGEMIEIGGGFRIPEMIEASGAIIREVGTTNRTHLRDYESAIGPHTALIVKIHPSNFVQQGYTATVETEDLVRLAKKNGIAVLEDQGSGLVMDLNQVGIKGVRREPTVKELWAKGVDCLTFSGDKLMGGPQCGFILAAPENLERMRRDPMYRTFRLSKLDLAALEMTLQSFLETEEKDITPLNPVFYALGITEKELKKRAHDLQEGLAHLGWDARVEREFSEVGGGALPAVGMPSWVVRVKADHFSGRAEGLNAALRQVYPAVITRIVNNQVCCDVRTVFDRQISVVVEQFGKVQPRRDSSTQGQTTPVAERRKML